MIDRLGILAAVGCSLLLTILTVTPPQIPGDWARLDTSGVYIAPRIDNPWPSGTLQIGLWLGMVGGLFATGYRPSVFRQSQKKHQKTSRNSLLLVTGIMLVGFGLRVHSLDRLPLIIDEIGFAAHASDILHGQHVPILAPGHNANPSAYSWLLAGAMAIFGQNAFAVRLIPLVAGTLTLPAVYVFGRAWWGERVGVMAAAFVAVYPAHVHFSRVSVYNIFDPMWAMLALACFAAPLTPASIHSRAYRQYWIVAGILAGVAQYFYHGSRLLPLLMVMYIGLSAVSFQRSAVLKTRVPASWRDHNILWMGLALLVVALPRFAPMLTGGLPLTGNMETMRLPADLGANSLRAILAWVGQPDVSPFWLSEARLLEWGALAAFIVGLAVCIRRIKEARYAVMACWLALTTVFGGAIWTAAPFYVRYMSALPAIAVLAAVGVEAASHRWWAIRQKRPNTTGNNGNSSRMAVILIGLVGAQGMLTAWRHPDEAYRRITSSQWAEVTLARKAAGMGENISVVFVVPENFNSVQEITLAHYTAALGERRSIALAREGESLTEEQKQALNDGYVILSTDAPPLR